MRSSKRANRARAHSAVASFVSLPLPLSLPLSLARRRESDHEHEHEHEHEHGHEQGPARAHHRPQVESYAVRGTPIPFALASVERRHKAAAAAQHHGFARPDSASTDGAASLSPSSFQPASVAASAPASIAASATASASASSRSRSRSTTDHGTPGSSITQWTNSTSFETPPASLTACLKEEDESMHYADLPPQRLALADADANVSHLDLVQPAAPTRF